MSGLPNPPQAKELGDALREIGKLGPRIDACRIQSANLVLEADALSERRAKLWRRAEHLLEVMDCASTGNAGYQRRMFALLAMLVPGDSTPIPPAEPGGTPCIRVLNTRGAFKDGDVEGSDRGGEDTF